MNGLRMHNNEFERQVQQKTEGLKITPSAGLWDTIEGQLPPEKKRRRPLLWLLALLLAGGGAAWWVMGTDHATVTDNPPATATSNRPATNNPTTTAHDSSRTTAAAHPTLPDPVIKDAAMQSPSVQQGGNLSVAISSADSNQSQVQRKMSVAEKIRMRTRPSKAWTIATNGVDDGKDSGKGLPSPKGKTAGQVNIQIAAANATTAISIDSAAATMLPKLPTTIMPMIAVSTPTAQQHQLAQRSFIGPTDAANNRVQKKQGKQNWAFGFTAGLGLSKRNDKLFSSGDEKRLAMVSNGLSSPGVVFDSTNSGAIKKYKPGLSFHMGLYAKRPIGNRWLLQTGLLYSYLSGRQPAGKEYVSFNNNSFVSLGNKAYVNKIHLVQVPVELQYQLAQQSKWHLLMGTTLGYLINSNLLVYETNGTSPIYIKGNYLYNRIQLMGHIGTAIRPKPTSALTWGMRVQYGITTLTKKEVDAQRMIAAQVFCQIPFPKK